jgi:hypothetical protein
MELFMRLRLISLIALAILMIAACQGPPPTQIVLVVTATPTPVDGIVESPSGTSADTVSATIEPSITPSPAATSTPDPFPTPTISDILVAEEKFEHGHMFWLGPVQQIWVLAENEDDPTRGIWTVYDDTFVEGQLEIDPTIKPPAGMFQPERGFGKLWRENPEIREALGWATESEFGHVTHYEYHPGGTVNAQNEYVPGPGYHILYSVLGDAYRFNEAEVAGQDMTWELVK